MPTFYIKLSLIFLWKKFSEVLFAYLIQEDVRNVLLLLACKPEALAWSSEFIAAVSTFGRSHYFGLHWSWSKNHRRLLSRCSAGTTSSTCYLKQCLLNMWAEWSKDRWIKTKMSTTKRRSRNEHHKRLAEIRNRTQQSLHTFGSFYLLNKMWRNVGIILLVQFSKYLERFSMIWSGISRSGSSGGSELTPLARFGE